MNGQVSYATDMTSPYEFGTVATFTCNAGFSLDGAADTLTCADDDQLDTVGTWGGTEPTCERMSIVIRLEAWFSQMPSFLQLLSVLL